MITYKVGQTVTKKYSETHGLIIDVWTNKMGVRMVTLMTGRLSTPIALEAREVTPYIIQSPDVVMLTDIRGNPWLYEVCDVSADGLSVIVKEELDGKLYTVPMSEITRVIPASIARLHQLVGAGS